MKTSETENFVELKFLSTKNSITSEEENLLNNNRIGNENDFIYNLLKKSALSCEKCRLNIATSLETLNNLNRKKESTLIGSVDDNNQSVLSEQPTTSFSNSANATADTSSSLESELLKTKKLKAKARQQRILAQMSNSQQAFLSNPINKLDVEAFKEATKATPIISQTSPNTELNEATQTSLLSNLIDDQQQQATTSSNIGYKEQENDDDFQCCICRLTEKLKEDRPLGAVTLLQSTSGN